jgi:4a-hydroxytetrahydrobiopterin dehydratase
MTGGILCAMATQTKMTVDEARRRMPEVPGWELEGEQIRKKLTFKDFRDAIAFVVRLAFEAEEADHHPDILISYKRVTLTYSTHSAGGLTDKDFAGAAAANALAARLGA